MKFKNIFWRILTIAITFSSCDVITNPILPHQQNSTLPNAPPTYRDSSTSAYTYKLLLEDCMGDLCSNCPSAAAIADTLISPTGGNPNYAQVIMMEDQMGFDAIPTNSYSGAPSYAFTTDYRSAAGNAWCIMFGINADGYPTGLINRLGSAKNITYLNWQDSVSKIIQRTTQSVVINIHDSCWVPQRIIGVEFQLTFLKPLSGNYSLETLIVENHIVSWQVDQYVNGGFDSTFVHSNVLRGAFGNNAGGLPWGTAIPNTTPGSTWTSYQTYDFNKGENGNAAGGTSANPTPWNMANCYIVAFVFNSQTYQVIQAEMIKVE